MGRLVRDFVEVEGGVPLADLIERLVQVQEGLPDGTTDVTIRLRGDDVFGHKLSVSYLRPQTLAERARDARYVASDRGASEEFDPLMRR